MTERTEVSVGSRLLNKDNKRILYYSILEYRTRLKKDRM